MSSRMQCSRPYEEACVRGRGGRRVIRTAQVRACCARRSDARVEVVRRRDWMVLRDEFELVSWTGKNILVRMEHTRPLVDYRRFILAWRRWVRCIRSGWSCMGRGSQRLRLDRLGRLRWIVNRVQDWLLLLLPGCGVCGVCS